LSYPSVQADTALLEKQQAFDRSKIQERIVHPAGWAAFGEFVVTKDVTHLTKAKLFGSVGKKTPTFTRLSTVTYGREYPDSARNPRGHATKFYTEDGNYDLVGLNFPVFFVRDPFQGPDNIRSQQREPKSFLLNYNGWFDFLANVSLGSQAPLVISIRAEQISGTPSHLYPCGANWALTKYYM
jgi:catalase